MPSNRVKVVMNIAGGLATDFGPSFTGAPQGNALSIPFLVEANNVYYELDGAPHKIGGASRMNSANQVTEGGLAATFAGIYDAWYQGVAGSETQKRVAYAGTKLMKEDLDGVWDTLKSGLEETKQPCFEIFTDLCITATTSNVDVPQKWDGSAVTSSDLGGSPPNFAFHVKHKNRLWASGVVAHPSRLYYCNTLAPEDWAGGGSIDIDPDDGDRIVGLISHKNELIVFKGPNKLSIHRITGSSPSDFARVPFITGIGGIEHATIYRVNDDVVFASPRGLHSLAATAAYGDYVEAFLSRPILSYYQDSLNHNALAGAWGCNYQARGLALWTFPASGGTTKNTYLAYDYRFQPGRWARWTNYQNANCLAIMQNSSRKHRVFAGTTEGYVYELDITDRSINGATAYTWDVKTPFLNFGTSAHLKTAAATWVSFPPKGDYNLTFGYTRDDNAEQTAAVPQSGGDVLATILLPWLILILSYAC